jgi:hypothetical protein
MVDGRSEKAKWKAVEKIFRVIVVVVVVVVRGVVESR